MASTSPPMDLVAASLASYFITNQEVYKLVLHPLNATYVKAKAEETLQRKIADEDFQQISIEVLQNWFSYPNNDPDATLREIVSRVNRMWIRTFVERHRANASLTENYNKAVQQSFLGQPKELPMPRLETRKGTRILIMDQGFGRNAVMGKHESQKIHDMYA